jgi:hypothetical protein
MAYNINSNIQHNKAPNWQLFSPIQQLPHLAAIFTPSTAAVFGSYFHPINSCPIWQLFLPIKQLLFWQNF